MAALLSSWSAVSQAGLSSPPVNEALSGIFGSISLTAWICLLLPQLITNYKAQSADGLSMAFLFVWMIGDIANLAGALCTRLAPTAIALACYFCVTDFVLIAQSLYYNAKNAAKARKHRARQQRRPNGAADESAVDEDDGTEDEPLLRRRRSSSAAGLPGSHRRHSMRQSESNLDPLTRIVTGEDETPDSNPWLHNTLSILAVWVVGTAGYYASYRMGAWDGGAPEVPGPEIPEAQTALEAIGLALGYLSAACYLCARIPQIIKNYREKSCEGLALLFFLLSLTGNLTYGASLVAYDQRSDYLLTALPWLLGSLGTIAEDLIIFAQFRIYSPKKSLTPAQTQNGGAYATV